MQKAASSRAWSGDHAEWSPTSNRVMRRGKTAQRSAEVSLQKRVIKQHKRHDEKHRERDRARGINARLRSPPRGLLRSSKERDCDSAIELHRDFSHPPPAPAAHEEEFVHRIEPSSLATWQCNAPSKKALLIVENPTPRLRVVVRGRADL